MKYKEATISIQQKTIYNEGENIISKNNFLQNLLSQLFHNFWPSSVKNKRKINVKIYFDRRGLSKIKYVNTIHLNKVNCKQF